MKTDSMIKPEWFVSKDFLHYCNDKGLEPFWFIDSRAIQAFINLKKKYTDIWVNDYDRDFNYSGYRNPDCTIGTKTSQHRAGRALDLHCIDTPALYAWIKSYYSAYHITTIEMIGDTPGWVHVDFRYTGQSDLLIVPGK